MRKFTLSSFILLPLSFFLYPSSLAEIDIGDDFKFQGGESAKNIQEFSQVGKLVSAWLPNVYVVAGLFVFFMVLAGGFAMITNDGDLKKLQEGQRKLTIALIGFAILFGSYWIIQIIQVLTGVPILNPSL